MSGRVFPLYVYDELFEFAQTSGEFTTISNDTANILREYGFAVKVHGIGWSVGKMKGGK